MRVHRERPHRDIGENGCQPTDTASVSWDELRMASAQPAFRIGLSEKRGETANTNDSRLRAAGDR